MQGFLRPDKREHLFLTYEVSVVVQQGKNSLDCRLACVFLFIKLSYMSLI